jgi:hypothetical protein
MPHILDPAFIYTPAAKTDIRLTFDRVRRELNSTPAAAGSSAATAAKESHGLDGAEILPAADLHPRLPAWMKAHAADDRADLQRARTYLDTDDRR